MGLSEVSDSEGGAALEGVCEKDGETRMVDVTATQVVRGADLESQRLRVGGQVSKAFLIVFRSKRDRAPLGWGIYGEYPLAQCFDGTETEQKLLLFCDAETYQRAEDKLRDFVGRDLRYLWLSQLLQKTVLQEGVGR